MQPHGLSRRDLLALGAAGASLAAFPAAAAGPSLKQLANAKGLAFGSAVGSGPSPSQPRSLEDARYRQLLLADCDTLVPENELKWAALRPDAASFNFERADRIAAFAQQNGLKLRGHTLLWNHPKFLPAWLTSHDFGSRPAAAAEAMLTEHVQKVCGRYPQIVSWDVVNETVNPPDGAIRRTVLTDAMGPEPLLDLTYRLARQAAPKARLVYNDFMSWGTGGSTHRTGVLKLLEGFKARGVPVDALGLQAHIGGAETGENYGGVAAREKDWRAFLDAVTGMGYDLIVSEFDVHDIGQPADIAARDAAVAAYGKAYLDIILGYAQTRELLTWGLVDRYSWLQNQWPRADGLPKRPDLYDDAYQAKPLRQAVAAALQAAPAR
jgi:endo-1,4-beta-xylanase